MADILLISKAVAPPWNDSSKNLVRDLALGMRRHRPHIFGRRGDAPLAEEGRADSIVLEAVYDARPGGFSPALSDQLRVLRRLLLGRGNDLWHFFFAPNPRSSQAGRLSSTLRRRPTVHTVCSAPREGAALERILFADRTIVLSAHTEARLLAEGFPRERLARVPPSVPLLPVPTTEERMAFRREIGVPNDRRLLVYPGDLEFSQGARWSVEAATALPDVHLVIASRLKTPAARAEEASIRELADRLGISASFLGETPAILKLLAAADIVLLPSETLYAKMDYPLVLLEAMMLGRPVVVGAATPAEELVEVGARVAEPGGEALAATVGELLAGDLDAIGLDCRERTRERFSPEAMAAAYERIYDDLL